MPEETENLNRLITTKEFGLIINKLSQEWPGPNASLVYFRKILTHVLQNLTKK